MEDFVWSPDSTKIAFSGGFYPQAEGDYSPEETNIPLGFTEGVYYVELRNPEKAILIYKYEEREGDVRERLLGWLRNSTGVIIGGLTSRGEDDITVDIVTGEKEVFSVDNIGQYDWTVKGDKMVYFSYDEKKIILEEDGSKKVLSELLSKDGNLISLSQRPLLSPDGRYVLYHKSNYAQNSEEIWLVDITKSDFPEILVTGVSQNQMWPDVYWLSDSETILYGIRDADAGRNKTDLYLISIYERIPHMVAESSYMPATSTEDTGLD
jgi:Tol biopolymer transport system component